MNIVSILLAIQDAISQGVLWGVMALGVYITFKVLDFADMTVDGSFACGGCVCAMMIVKGFNPFFSLLVAIVAGVIAGLMTGILHTVLKIPSILAGILTQLALYSINLRIMGRANTPLLKSITMVDHVKTGIYQVSLWVAQILQNIFKLEINVTPLGNSWVVLIIGVAFVILLITLLYMFFGTEIGSAIRATGNNEYMVRALGVNTNTMKILSLMLANGLVALSGALITQSQGYADVGMGMGTIVIGLASIVIGEVALSRNASFAKKLKMVIFGSITYRIIIAIVLQLGLKASDLKLLTAIIVAIALAIPTLAKGKRD